MHNSDLCDTLGNLVHRATNLCQKFCDGVVPDVPAPSTPPVDFAKVAEQYVEKMNKFELQSGASIAIAGFRDVNGYLQEQAPWALKGDDHAEARQIIVRASLEAIYALAHLLLPFTPQGAKKIFQKLNTEPTDLTSVDRSCRNLKAGTRVEVGDVLYTKSLSQAEIEDSVAAALKKKESFSEAQRRKKEEKAKLVEKSAQRGGSGDANRSDFSKMDIRVGQIVKVWNHPEADKLFCEQIDVGEDRPRDIASGLRAHYKLEDMENRKVLVVCNLKASKMVGFESQGMVLAAKSSDGSKVELVDVPDGAKIGERVIVKGEEGEPYSATQVKKKKTWEAVAAKLKTADGGLATWDSKPIETSAGACSVATLIDAPIS
jgi:methionine--tRNA ligase beta chain